MKFVSWNLAANKCLLQQLIATGCAVAQAVNRWFPTAAAWVRVLAENVGFVVNKAALEQVFFEYFGVPANHHSTNFSILITRGWHNRPISGRSAEWTQLDSSPYQLNKNLTACPCPL
jgi:hypothetical protein